MTAQPTAPTAEQVRPAPAPWPTPADHATPGPEDAGKVFFAKAGVTDGEEVWGLSDAATIYTRDGLEVAFHDTGNERDALALARTVAAALNLIADGHEGHLSVPLDPMWLRDHLWDDLGLSALGFSH